MDISNNLYSNIKVQSKYILQCEENNTTDQEELKARFFKNRELYWSNLPQNSNLGRESFVQKSGVQIPVGEGKIFCHFSLFIYLFHVVHKKLNIKT